MRHYHGTPIGGKKACADEFAEGRLLLIPWKDARDLDRAMAFSRGFIVDNSAFSFWRTGEKPNWHKYIKWCKEFARHPRFDFALIPDVIDGSEEENDKLISMWNKQAWHPVFVAGCPVWHMHESIERLQRLCRHYDRVAIGSSGQWPRPGVGSWWTRMDEAFDAICDESGFPAAKIHGLRMLNPSIVERYPFSSCDSTNAVQNGSREASKNRVDALWGQKTIARRIESSQSPCRWVKSTDQSMELFSLHSTEEQRG